MDRNRSTSTEGGPESTSIGPNSVKFGAMPKFVPEFAEVNEQIWLELGQVWPDFGQIWATHTGGITAILDRVSSNIAYTIDD